MELVGYRTVNSGAIGRLDGETRNCPRHVAEGTFNRPTQLAVSGHWRRSLAVSGTPTPVPNSGQGFDWKGDLVTVIGRQSKVVTAAEGLKAVIGNAVFNNVTANDTQHRTTPWTVGTTPTRAARPSKAATPSRLNAVTSTRCSCRPVVSSQSTTLRTQPRACS